MTRDGHMRHLASVPECRRHDLPPRWDGRIVRWSEWDTSPTFVCGPRGPVRASRCEGCGSTASNATSRGTVYPLAGDTYESEQPIVKRTRSGREYPAGDRIVTANWRHPVTSLVAFRCQRCGLDEVLDMHSGERWTLDDSDYGDEGSTSCMDHSATSPHSHCDQRKGSLT